MKIRSCEIKSFGKLCDKTVCPGDGITVIHGRNESGKSTLCAFIKYVLYGFPGRGSRDERNNEKLRYTPWNGLKCAGALLLEDNSHDLYRVERKSDGKTSKGVILNSGGSECYEGFDAGDVFYGIDASAFEKSSFVGQDDIEPDDMKDLGTSLENIVFGSDEEEHTLEEAKKDLTGQRNKLYNKMRGTGRIFELESAIEELRAKRIAQSENNGRLNTSEYAAEETEKKLAVTDKRLEALYREDENISAYKAAELLGKIELAHAKMTGSEKIYGDIVKRCSVNGFVPDRGYIDTLTRAHSAYMLSIPEAANAEKELELLTSEYSSVIAGIHESGGFDASIETDNTQTSQVLEKARELHTKAKKLNRLGILFFCLIVTIPIAVVMFVLSSKKKKELSELLGKYGFKDISELEGFCKKYDELYPSLEGMRENISKTRNIAALKADEREKSRESLVGILAKAGFSIPEDEASFMVHIRDSLIPAMSEDVAELERTYGEYVKDKNSYEALISVSDMEKLRELASKKSDQPPQRPKEEVDRAIKYDEGAKALLSKKLNDLKIEITRLRAITADPADIENKIYELEKELSEARLNCEALEFAMEFLDKAASEIRSDVFPSISQRAGELFSKFTGGKYRSLFFDKDFALKFLMEGETETRKAGFLSAGTYDAAYIALRVALAEHLCKNKPTLIFDDSFAKIDDERLGNILSVLYKLSDEYQIMILSCHDREARMLGDKCKVITLDED